jgi:hypothetical protein
MKRPQLPERSGVGQATPQAEQRQSDAEGTVGDGHGLDGWGLLHLDGLGPPAQLIDTSWNRGSCCNPGTC